MICPRCGAVYQNAAYCPNDGTPLVPHPAAAPPPKSKKNHTALIVAIVLVVAVAGAGLFVARDRLGILGGQKVDWTRGVTASWSRQFTVSPGYESVTVFVQAPQVWVVREDSAIEGVDPATGNTMWRHDSDPGDWSVCADALVNGKVACLEPDPSQSNNAETACLIDANTGQQSCVALADVVKPLPGHSGNWDRLWVSDGSLVVAGEVWVEDPYSYSWQVARLSVPALTAEWSNEYDGCADYSSSPSDVEYSTRQMSGITGNVLWFGGPTDEGPGALAVDIRNGQPITSPSNAHECVALFPLTTDTFLTSAPGLAGQLPLPAGGQITVANQGNGAIVYDSGQFPNRPVYYTYDWKTVWSAAQATLGSGGATWPVVVPLFVVRAAGGAVSLKAAASGNTLVVGGAGQAAAVDVTTGKAIWSTTVPCVEDEYWFCAGSMAIVGGVAVFSTYYPILSEDIGLHVNQVTLLNLATGQTVGQMPGRAFVSSDGDMVGVLSGSDTDWTLTRYVPVS